FTLPVLIAMLSNHYGFLYGAPNNWLVLVAIMVAGALIRHSFVARHKALVQGKTVPWGYAVAGTAIIVALALWLMPAPQPKAAAAPPATYSQLRQVLDARCVLCHNDQLASKNVKLVTSDDVAKNAQMLYQQVVILKTMPLNNATQITDAERALIGRWYTEGASVK
ncbi:MAG TPA: urate hydroxylase PuuD, partial [Burkholderiaceae bacterium]|nr:urate hydroxylase PuuD [Burkholderiaceae bacterium]